MIMKFKIMTGRVRLDKSKLFDLRENSKTCGHGYKIVKKQASSSSKRSTFCNRIVNDWNGLPQYVVDSNKVDAL